MAAAGGISINPEDRHATVLVDYVRTAAAAGVTETIFHREGECPPPGQEELQDLEERIRRLAAHHLNDLGIPVLAQRPFTVEAGPEFAFLVRAAATALKYLPGMYKGTNQWWRSRQDKIISTHFKTAVVSFDLRHTWDEHKLAAVAGLPILERKILEAFPGIKIHVRLRWATPSLDMTGATAIGGGKYHSVVVTSGCVQRNTVIALLRKLDAAKGGRMDQSLVVLRGRRWKSLFLSRIWVLPQNHYWAVKQNHLDPRNTAKRIKAAAGVP